MQESKLIVIEPGDLVVIGGLTEGIHDYEILQDLRKELPDAKVFGFRGDVTVQLLHGEGGTNSG